ncbi:MAG: winged helix-turn-helix domain-containing protein [Bdellovibrionales bacterium]|nr:winged helix-turn-helix domain-containing protein [Bdellovibrionales bacterium]
MLRLLAEQERFDRVEKIQAQVLSYFKDNSLDAKLLSRLKYVLGICHVYRGDGHEEAMNCFRESIQTAVASGDRSALGWPLYGAATVLYARDRHDDALKELEKLSTLLECHPIPDLQSSALLLNALILRNQGRQDEALKYAWKAFETLKEHPHLGLYLHTLATLGTIFGRKGETQTARIYLDLASRSLKREELPRIARIVDDAMTALGGTEDRPDLELNLESGVLNEIHKGEIRFDGQFLLRDLLSVFLRSSIKTPGRVLKKEDLVREVWGEQYDPTHHDNKVYVNIKRLRRLIEAEDGATEYIVRGKQGYYLNPKARVSLIENNRDH